LGVPPDEEIETNRRETELARAVMDYLAEHPQAMDNVQGIAEWWVTWRQVQVEIEILRRVLQHLVDKDLLEKIDSAEGPLYRLRR
jgi:hypothetical protein